MSRVQASRRLIQYLMKMKATPVIELNAQLGEGLHWDAAHGVLWGVDIHGAQVWRWVLHSHTWQSWQMAQRVGWVLPEVGSNRVLIGMQGGFALADRDAPDRIQWLQEPFGGNTSLRLNDAKADSSGAVWAGSLNNDDESRSDGCLFRLDKSGQLKVVDDGYTVANGPAVREDGKLMLHTDSGRRTIYAFSLDVMTGTLTDKRVWLVLRPEEGYPDGMCFDAEGCVWVAHWGAGCVSRYSIDGQLLCRVGLPVKQVTSVCFGGPSLDRLFVTTARVGLSEVELEGQPYAGALFEIENVGVTGIASLPAGPFQVKAGV